MTFCLLAYLVLQEYNTNVKFSFQITIIDDNILFCFHESWAARPQLNTKKKPKYKNQFIQWFWNMKR